MSPIYEFSYVIEDGLALLPGLLAMIPSGAIGIATYVLSALALYTIASRRGINHPWLSWVPVANIWILGSLSDQYRYVVKGENKSKRKSLLTLCIIRSAITVLIIIAAMVMVVGAVRETVYGMGGEDRIIGAVLSILALSLPMAGVALAEMILRYMALYDLYTSCDPQNNVLFLVLSVLFNVTEPFFLFFNRNRDEGMPPRRQEPEYIPPEFQQWHQPQQETWQTPEEPGKEPWEEEKDYL